LTDYLSKMIYDRHYIVLKESVLHEIKKSLCKVSLCGNVRRMLKEVEEKKEVVIYKIPDTDSEIMLDKELYLCPEAIFNPRLFTEEDVIVGLHDSIYNCILSYPESMRQSMYGNIILSGGSTAFPHFRERLLKELTDLAPTEVNIGIFDNPHGDNSLTTWHSIATPPHIEIEFIPTSDYELNYSPDWIKVGGLISEDKNNDSNAF